MASFALGGALLSSGHYAWGQVISDNTLKSDVISPIPGAFLIQGGVTQGTNLFHSFSQFSVPSNGVAYFKNELTIQNIITRVTGGSVSNIDGLIKANGTANLFLINPNGIIFGPNAQLYIGGSFIGSTASSLDFADGTQFSTTAAQNTPLLTVSVPIGLQFGGNPGRILVQGKNQSTNRRIPLNSLSVRARDVSLAFAKETLEIIRNRDIGLEVLPTQTLALVGGDVVLEGGSLTTKGGRIELGSVGGSSLVSLSPTDKGWTLGYDGVQRFQNIQLSRAATINASGVGGGDIHLRGGQVTLTDQSIILATTLGNQDGGEVSIRANQLTLDRASIVGTGTTLGAAGNSGNLTLETENLTIQNSIVQSGTGGSGHAGDLTVRARDSVKVIQQGFLVSGSLSSGAGGNLTLETGRLIIQDGSVVNTGTFGTGLGGNLVIRARESVEVSGTDANDQHSLLSAETNGVGDAGNLTITTLALTIRDKGTVSVTSEDLGEAGQITVTTGSIQMDNQGRIVARTRGVNGGNITLQAQDLMLLRHGSKITTTAGTANAGGDGGNIKIDTDFIVAVPGENSDITANAFTGKGGRVTINAQSIFGMVPRSREDLVRLLGTNDPTKLDPDQLPTNDITAISQTNPTLSGAVTINRPDVDPSRGLAELPGKPVNVEVTQGCQGEGKQASVAFFNTGRGGLAPNPYEPISSSEIWEDVPPPTQRTENSTGAARTSAAPATPPNQIVEAQGWLVNEKGEVVLVAQMPTTRSQGRCRLR